MSGGETSENEADGRTYGGRRGPGARTLAPASVVTVVRPTTIVATDKYKTSQVRRIYGKKSLFMEQMHFSAVLCSDFSG